MGLVDASGNLAEEFTYEPFGVPTLSGQSSVYPYLFAGMEFDATTGLYHTPARYYSPRLQRFLSEDPLQFGGGDANLFGNAVGGHGLRMCSGCSPGVVAGGSATKVILSF